MKSMRKKKVKKKYEYHGGSLESEKHKKENTKY